VFLIEKGANLTFKTRQGETALHLLIKSAFAPSKPQYEALIGRIGKAPGVSWNGSITGSFSFSFSFSFVFVLVAFLVNVLFFLPHSPFLFFFLSSSLPNQQRSVFRITDVLDGQGETALHIACSQGNEKAVVCLLENNSDPNILNPNTGDTALHVAVRLCSSNPKLVRVLTLLLNYGATTSASNLEGFTPVQLSEKLNACSQVVEILNGNFSS
jgi:ankyrin repeat protein